MNRTSGLRGIKPFRQRFASHTILPAANTSHIKIKPIGVTARNKLRLSMENTSHAPQSIDARKKLCRHPKSGKKLAINNTSVMKANKGKIVIVLFCAQPRRGSAVHNHGLTGHERRLGLICQEINGMRDFLRSAYPSIDCLAR